MSTVLRPSSQNEIGAGKYIRGNNNGGNNDFVVARCHQILAYYEEEAQKPEHKLSRWLVDQLNSDEQELAARCSYAYWLVSTLPQRQEDRNLTMPPVSENARFATAVQEACRHIPFCNDPVGILRYFRATLEFHKTRKTWLYRTCMTEDRNDDDATTGDDLLGKQRRDRIYNEMTNYMANVIRGHDREDRAILFVCSRKSAGTLDTEEGFVDAIIYALERAMACSEFLSVGRQDQIFCVINTKGATCPPLKLLQGALGPMQNFYPGRLKHCAVLHAPYLLTAMFKLIKPFMDPVTASKFVFVSPKENQKGGEKINELIDESNAMPVLMPGRGRLSPKTDVDHFLYEVPFYQHYDYSETPSYGSGLGTKDELHQLTERTALYPDVITESSSVVSGLSSSNKFSVKKRLRSRIDAFIDHARYRRGAYRTKSRRKSKKNVVVSVRSLGIGKLVLIPEEGSTQVSMMAHRQ